MPHEMMAPIMFGALVVFLLLGYPVAFSLAANGIFFGLIGIELGLLKPELLQALPERVFGIMRNDTLLAIPFFTFMGLILERSGMAEELLDTIGRSSARCAAVLPTQWCSSAPCSPQRPGSSPRPSSRWG